jgi:hypothetical protein
VFSTVLQLEAFVVCGNPRTDASKFGSLGARAMKAILWQLAALMSEMSPNGQL